MERLHFFPDESGIGKSCQAFQNLDECIIWCGHFYGNPFPALKNASKGSALAWRNLWHGSYPVSRKTDRGRLEGLGGLLDSKRPVGMLRIGVL